MRGATRVQLPQKEVQLGGGATRPAYKGCTRVTRVQPPSPGPGVARCLLSCVYSGKAVGESRQPAFGKRQEALAAAN